MTRNLQQFCKIAGVASSLALTAALAVGTATADTIRLAVGQAQLVDHNDVKRVAVGNDKALGVRVLSDTGEILLSGKDIGVTHLLVWTRNGDRVVYDVQITSEALDAKADSVERMLEDIEGVRVELYGDGLAIDGHTITERDRERVRAVAETAGVANLTTSDPTSLRATITMDVKLVEISRNKLKEIGIRWDTLTTGPSVGYVRAWHSNPSYAINNFPQIPIVGDIPAGDSDSSTYLGVATGLTSTLNLLAEKGFARFIAEPTLSCTSGGNARFQAGGVILIPITDRDGATSIEEKEYGIVLAVAPVSSPDGLISATIDIEVSAIDPSVSVLGVPGLSKRQTSTEMNAYAGETMVISGLVSKDSSKSVSKTPLLSKLPVLGELFKSRSFRTANREIVVFVTPYLTHPADARNRAAVERAIELNELADVELRFKLMD